MQFDETPIPGAYLVTPEPRGDERGSFARIFCADEFAERAAAFEVRQGNLSTSTRAGTVRGLHYQLTPHRETKFVRCTRGALFDVAVDLRPDSTSFGTWYGVELTADNQLGLVVPEGCAHGFQTLADDTDALYLVSAAYAPSHERGVHHADPGIGIAWPHTITTVSERDRSLPTLAQAELP